MNSTCTLRRVLTRIARKKNGKKTKQNISLMTCEKFLLEPCCETRTDEAPTGHLPWITRGPVLVADWAGESLDHFIGDQDGFMFLVLKSEYQLCPSDAFSFFKKSKWPRSRQNTMRSIVFCLRRGHLIFFKNGSFILIYNQFGYPAVHYPMYHRIRPSSAKPRAENMARYMFAHWINVMCRDQQNG